MFFRGNRLKITCFGSSKGSPGETQYDAMQEVGRLLAAERVVVVTGGYGGSGMEAAARGASESGGSACGYTLECSTKQPNPYLAPIIPSDAFLSVEKQYCERLGSLLQSDGFVVDPTDDTPGTLIEFFSVMNLNMKFWKDSPRPVVVLRPPPEGRAIGSFEHIIITFCLTQSADRPWLCLADAPEGATDWLLPSFHCSSR